MRERNNMITEINLGTEILELRDSEMAIIEIGDYQTDTLDRNVLERSTLKAALEQGRKMVEIASNFWAGNKEFHNVGIWRGDNGCLQIGCKKFSPEQAAQIIDWAKNEAGQ